MESQRPASQKLPAGLAGVLNQDDNRDSAYFSSTDASSKHTSAASGLGVSVLSPTGSAYRASPSDKTPSPVSATLIPQPLVSPAQSNMSVASMVSPTTPSSADPRRFDRPTSLDSAPSSATFEGHMHPESRRESVDSRINQGFHDLRLGNSPYASHNQSTTSIQNTLNTQRNPRPGLEALSIHRISNGYQPSNDRNPEQHSKVVTRTAPAITGPATSHIARAAEPTKGQAWAFPEEEIQKIGPHTSYLDSRRSSIADSIASSQFTTESRLPPGQLRLDEGTDFNRLSSASQDFPPVHHHSLQHKQLDDLQDDDLDGRTGSQPYSRTPELRKSHKLAERKRRTEMKELFEALRDLMPQERGSKASKWEILTKAISEHQRMAELIRILQTQNGTLMHDNDVMRRENHNMRVDISRLQTDIHSLRLQQSPTGQQPPPSQAAPPSAPYPSDQYSNAGRPELPPLRTLGGQGQPGPDSMTGVQYEATRTNGYRPERY